MGSKGESRRTNAKLLAFRFAMGREAGIFRNTLTRYGAEVQIFLDLNSADASKVVNGALVPWSIASTAAIAAKNAAFIVAGGYPAEVRLHEKIPKTRRDLIENLERYLPQLACERGLQWRQIADERWICDDGMGSLTVGNNSDTLHRFPPKASVFVAHDPNSFGSWSMGDPVFDCLDRVKYLTTAHWINFNGRVKMMASDSVNLAQPERWRNYCRLLNRLLDMVGPGSRRPDHDILLFRVLNDDQWAFFVTCHTNFVESTRADIVNRMGRAGVEVDPFLRSETPISFREQIRELTLTKAQLAAIHGRTITHTEG